MQMPNFPGDGYVLITALIFRDSVQRKTSAVISRNETRRVSSTAATNFAKSASKPAFKKHQKKSFFNKLFNILLELKQGYLTSSFVCCPFDLHLCYVL